MAVRGYKDARGRQRYEVEFVQAGERVHKRAPPATTYAQAKEWETNLRRELFAGGTLGHQSDVLLVDLIRDWLDTNPHKAENMRKLRNIANRIGPFCIGKSWRDAPAVADDVEKACVNQELARKTINTRLNVLKSALHWGADRNKNPLPENLSHKIKLRRKGENRRLVHATRAQILAIARRGDAQIRTATMWGGFMGLRAAEVLALDPKDLHGDLVTVHGKGDKVRVVPFPPLLMAYRRGLPVGLTYDQLRHGFELARDKAGVGPEITFHALRHGFASMMANKGVDLTALSRLMGHASVAITGDIYSHLYPETLRKAVRKLG